MNLLAIIIAAVANMAIGIAWYSPALFGNAWMKLTGVREMKPTAPKILAGFVSALIIAFVMSFLFGLAGVVNPSGFMGVPTHLTLLGGLLAGALIWAGFVATISINPVLWQGSPVKLYLIDNGCQLIILMVMGAIIGMMP